MYTINYKSNVPVYEQLQINIKELIFKNALREGDKLPSIREMAVIITVNPNTVKKVYDCLEKLTIIETLKGKGTYISKNAYSLVKDEKKSSLNNDLDKICKQAIELNMSYEKLVETEKYVFVNLKGVLSC